MTASLISIIGPPTSGKTTLAEHLADELPARLIREDYAGNPFLAESYMGSPDARLPGQLYFLLSRVKQLYKADFPAKGLVVSDYGFCQDRIYARLRLTEVDFHVYQGIAARVGQLVQPPKLMIHLDAPAETLLERIARRGRDYEKVMTERFLSDMRADCQTASADAHCPVMTVDTDSLDIRDSGQLAELTAAVMEKL